MGKYYRKPYTHKADSNQPRPTDNELHDLFGRLAELVDTVATSRHIEAMEAYQIIDRIINYYQQS